MLLINLCNQKTQLLIVFTGRFLREPVIKDETHTLLVICRS